LTARPTPSKLRRVNAFRALWQVHKWLGIALGVVLLVSATTGLLLLRKKQNDWIQPPTQRGTTGPIEDVLPMHVILAAAFALGDARLDEEADVDRVDFRPGRRVFKIRSKHDDVEIQVDAITGEAFAPTVRYSDWIERLHDGSAFGAWTHGLVMPLAALAFVLLSLSGYGIWIWPILRKRRQRRLRAQAASRERAVA
jgi:uncharacterized iron-regulated membrane protein